MTDLFAPEGRYKVEFSRRAAREFGRLALQDQRRVARKIDVLAVEPRPDGCAKLEGFKSAFRIRVGDFRIVYEVDDEARIITVARVGSRGQVYRG